jgi:hypothetical protein
VFISLALPPLSVHAETRHAAFEVREVSSTCNRTIRRASKFISNRITVDIDSQIDIKFTHAYTSFSPLGKALRRRHLFGSGQFAVQGFTAQQTQPFKLFINGKECTFSMTVEANKSLAEAGFTDNAPLIPIEAVVEFKCPKISCNSIYEGTIDNDPV